MLLSEGLVSAQEAIPQTPQPDTATQATITYGQIVEETLTQNSFFDQWLFYGTEGDSITARMVASDGLAPLLGIVNSGGELVARSDIGEDGVELDAAVNGISVIDFVLPATGEYSLIATRAGNESGTTSGSYSLTLTLMESMQTNQYQEVMFRCGSTEIVSAAIFELNAEPSDSEYQITVYGLDGFDPYIRVDAAESDERMACSNDVGETTDQQITLPDDGEVTVDQARVKAAQLLLPEINQSGVVRIIIGSEQGAAGRFYAVVEGPVIQPEGNFDRVNILPAPRARHEAVFLYMLRHQRTRIDPQISFVMEDAEEQFSCDDAGRFECDHVASAEDYRFPLSNGEYVTGDRLSAGIVIQSAELQRAFVQLRSRSATTQGAYVMLLAGVLPDLMLDAE